MKTWIIYLLSLVGACLFYLLYEGYLSYLLVIFMLCIPILSLIYLLLSFFQLHLSLSINTPITTINETINMTITRDYPPCFPVGNIHYDVIQDQVLSQLHNVTTHHFIQDQDVLLFTCDHCGKTTISLYRLFVYDFLGLFHFKKRIKLNESWIVLPLVSDIHYLVKHVSKINQSEQYDTHHSGDDYSELFDIRPYRQGDPINRIHWKLTLKQKELMIKEGSRPLDDYYLLTYRLTYHSEVNDSIFSLFHSFALFLCKEEKPFTIAYKIMRHPELVICHITSFIQYQQCLHEMLSGQLEKEFPIRQHHALNDYLFHFHFNEHGVYEGDHFLSVENTMY